MHHGIKEPRNFRCPLAEAPCCDPGCNIVRCRDRERERDADLRRKAEAARFHWEKYGAHDRRKAALRLLHEIAAEQSAQRGVKVGIPPGKEAEFIDKVLLKEKYAEGVRRHLEAIRRERGSPATSAD